MRKTIIQHFVIFQKVNCGLKIFAKIISSIFSPIKIEKKAIVRLRKSTTLMMTIKITVYDKGTYGNFILFTLDIYIRFGTNLI
jgi:hypothetical protein